jgi:hypothetical protein
MKKNLVILILLTLCNLFANAQKITQADVDAIDMTPFDTNGDGKIKDDEAALAIMQQYALDQNNCISRVQIIDNIDQSKEQIYLAVNEWFIHTFQSSKSEIQLNDKESGCIIGKGYVDNITSTMSFTSNADISCYVIIRVDIKDGKLRVTTTIQSYEMEKGLGKVGIMAGPMYAMYKKHVELVPSECFPFTKKNKKEAAKAFVKGHLFSMIMINKLEDAVRNSVNGTDNDW